MNETNGGTDLSSGNSFSFRKLLKPKVFSKNEKDKSMERKKAAKNIAHFDMTRKYLEEARQRFQERYAETVPGNLNLMKYDPVTVLGTGSYGRVILLQDRESHEYFAMKVMSKVQIVKMRQIAHIVEEKRILYSCQFPLLVKMYAHGQDHSFLYLVMEYVCGGELFSYLKKVQRLSESHARFYAAQVVLAFEYLHFMDVIYRDLKPENILIDRNGYIKGYNKSVDWYTLGILIYEMTAGYTPFWAESHMQIYENVIEGKVRFPKSYSRSLQCVVKDLTNKDLTRRCGNLKNGVLDIKDHEWFHETNWNAVFNMQVPAPFIPEVTGPGDCHNFEKVKVDQLVIDHRNQFGDAFAAF